jgi:hypothetical protein
LRHNHRHPGRLAHGFLSMSDQILFGTNDFTINPEPRVPCQGGRRTKRPD